jgi:hypothetical protein
MIAILAKATLGRRADRDFECRERSPIGSVSNRIFDQPGLIWYLSRPGSGSFPLEGVADDLRLGT